MKVLEVDGKNADFYNLCCELEMFQFNLLPVLKEKGYCLTSNLQEVIKAYVLYNNNAVVGCVGLRPVTSEVCEIVRVYVKKKFRCKGYATMLIEKVENLAKELGFKFAEMTAWLKAESAIKLYKKLGYNHKEEKISKTYGGQAYVELFKTL